VPGLNGAGAFLMQSLLYGARLNCTGVAAMSDSYEALVDCDATLEQAKRLAHEVVGALSKAGLIIPTLSSECVLGGAGYPAGAGCASAYEVEDDGELLGNRFWTLKTNGVEIHTTPWVNVWGFTQFASATCPRCGREHEEEFLDEVGNVVDDYLSSGVVPNVACSSCNATPSIHDWKCDPHLGFVKFAVVFWNWPPFASDEWRVDIQSLLQDHLKRPLVSTFGRM
jgi:hypothetical protein